MSDQDIEDYVRAAVSMYATDTGYDSMASLDGTSVVVSNVQEIESIDEAFETEIN